jgi:hypothetical protein
MRRLDIRQLRTIAAIRDLQTAAARGDAARAAAALEERNGALSDSTARRDAVAESWHAALSAPSLAIETLPLWTREVMRQDALVQQAEHGVASAKQMLDERAREYRAASKRGDVARDVVKSTVRARAAERDEAALNLASDLFLQRKRKTP